MPNSFERTSMSRTSQPKLVNVSINDAMEEMARKQQQLRQLSTNPSVTVSDGAPPQSAKSYDLMSDITDSFHQANAIARRSATTQPINSHSVPLPGKTSLTKSSTGSGCASPSPRAKKSSGSFIDKVLRLFSGKKAKTPPTVASLSSPLPGSKPSLPKDSAFVEDIAKKSQVVRDIAKPSSQSMQGASAPTDLMSAITDDWHDMQNTLKTKQSAEANNTAVQP